MWMKHAINLFIRSPDNRVKNLTKISVSPTKMGNFGVKDDEDGDGEKGGPSLATEERVQVSEGKVQILQPKSVFYNKVQEFNRDLSILAINTFIKNQYWKSAKFGDYVSKRDIKILDALSATGLRAVRYAKEVDAGDHPLRIHANDLLPQATQIIAENAARNGVGDKVSISTGDASLLMFKNRMYEDRFLVVDIDPYGCAAQFLDGAVQCISDGGLLMVTCTDMAILCGNHSETCFAKYGSVSLKGVCCHEQALRIVLRSIESSATRHGRYMFPLLSISADFYVRIFVQIFTSPVNAKKSASKTGLIFQCQECHTQFIQPMARYSESTLESGQTKSYYNMASGPVVGTTCEYCGGNFLIGGPIWIDPIHSHDFVEKLKQEIDSHAQDYNTFKRIRGMLEVISEELPDIVLYRTLDELCGFIKCPSPSMDIIRSAILNSGFRVSYSHAQKSSIKTDAPPSFLWDVMKKWNQDHPVEKAGGKKPNKEDNKKYQEQLLSQPIKHTDISFELRKDAQPNSKLKEFLRYQVNPERDWGPKPRPDNKKSKDQKRKKFKIDVESSTTADSTL
jgi:tRNA (guanine26-N2/guanine27-N2)-dimethyltransferase